MRTLTILLTLWVSFSLLNSEEILNKSDVIKYYEDFCDYIQGDYNLPDETLLNHYFILNQNKDALSNYLNDLNFSEMEYYDLNSFVIISGIFKLNDLENKIRKHTSFNAFLITNKTFYYYQITGSNYYLNILKCYSSLVINPVDIEFMELKTQAIDLLGWTSDEKILDFIKSVSTDGFDGMYSEMYSDSIHKLELFLKYKKE